jgi:Protein of unknown function (DUF3703)
MKPDQRERADQLIATEMATYRTARAANDSVMAWTALERAHIVSQPYLRPHLSNHWIMLQLAVSERNSGEIVGQIIRLALAPLGALTGRIPFGNTGRSNVSAFKTMLIPQDLRDAMAKRDQ